MTAPAIKDVTELVSSWFRVTFPSLQPQQWGATGARVQISLAIDKTSFNWEVQAAFRQWAGIFCFSLPLYEDVLRSAIAEDTKQRQDEFTSTPYQREETLDQFEGYLEECWRLHADNKYTWPLVSLVQSAGFGKSRLVYELAKRPNGHMRVLYTCKCTKEHYPYATPKLHEYFFSVGEQELVDRLVRLFDFALSRWDTVGDEWIDVFTDAAKDESIQLQLSAFVPAGSTQKTCTATCPRARH